MSCNGQPVIILGEDKTVNIRLVDSCTQNPVDLTGVSEITVKLQNEDSSVLALTLTGGAVSIISAPGGQIAAAMTAVQTALLAPSAPASGSDMQLSYVIAGKTTILQLLNSVQIISPLFS